MSNKIVSNNTNTPLVKYKSPKEEIFQYVIFVFCVVSTMFSFVNIKRAYFDTDTYFIVNTGKYILKNGLPNTNPFVIHNNLDMIVHQWLFDVILAKIYNIFGNTGLYITCSLLFLIIISCIYFLVKIISGNKKTAFCLAGFSGVSLFHFFTLRPTITTIIIVLCEFIFFEKFRKNHKLRYLVPIPLLSLFEANLHTSIWIVTIILIMPYIMPDVISKEMLKNHFIKNYIKEKKEILITIFLSTVAGLCNPYFIKGALYPFISYNIVANINIGELQKPTILSTFGFLLVSFLLITIYYVAKNKKNVSPLYLCLAMGTLFLGVMHCRDLWMAIVGILPISSILLSEYVERSDSKTSQIYNTSTAVSVKNHNTNKLIFTITFLLVTIFACVIAGLYINLDNYNAKKSMPTEILQTINEENNTDIKLYTGFNCGAYFQFNGYKTYIDARPEIYSKKFTNSEDIITEYIDIITGKANIENWINKYGFTHMVVYESLLKTYLKNSDDYELVLQDGEYELYEHIE